MFEVKRALLVHFVGKIKKTDFRAHFNNGRHRLSQFLKSIMSSITFLAKEIADAVRAEGSARLKPLKLTMFPSFTNPDL